MGRWGGRIPVTRPLLSKAVTWSALQEAALRLFSEALQRLAKRRKLPRTEEPINLELYREAMSIRHSMLQAGRPLLPFVILFDVNNQPEADDTIRSTRLKKRPDFMCAMVDNQARSPETSQWGYILECKRLGVPEGRWILNRNYADFGIRRFIHKDWQYAKRCPSAAMVGYIQNQNVTDVFKEVNSSAKDLALPGLAKPSAGWSPNGFHSIVQRKIKRSFEPCVFELTHLWIDLTKVAFDDAPEVVGPDRTAERRKRPTKKPIPSPRKKPAGSRRKA